MFPEWESGTLVFEVYRLLFHFGLFKTVIWLGNTQVYVLNYMYYFKCHMFFSTRVFILGINNFLNAIEIFVFSD